MRRQMQQKCLILRSRTQKPYFTIENRLLNITQNDIVVKTLCFSVDPVMKFSLAGARTYFRKVNIGDIFNCFGLAIVIKGNQQFQEGTYLFGNIGTCDINILDESRQVQCFPVPSHLVKMFGEKQFVYLINNGLAAYAGYKILSPKQGQNVIVSTASGATGLLLCQLLKKKGIKVIGLTSTHKFEMLVDHAQLTVDYKDIQKLQKILKQIKFKYYFDNVGQKLLDLILEYIEKDGKVALCGAIANYENYSNRGIKNTQLIISKRLTLTGLTFMGMLPNIEEAFEDFKGVNLKIHVIKIQDFEHYFTQILQSGNGITGKIIVKL